MVCVQETWIDPKNENTDYLHLNGLTSHFTSTGRGKGIGTYYKNKFEFMEEAKKPNYQMSKVSSEDIDVINVYRSSNASPSFLDDLKELIHADRKTHIVGDFNICYKKDRQNKVIQYLLGKGFRYVMESFSNM